MPNVLDTHLRNVRLCRGARCRAGVTTGLPVPQPQNSLRPYRESRQGCDTEEENEGGQVTPALCVVALLVGAPVAACVYVVVRWWWVTQNSDEPRGPFGGL